MTDMDILRTIVKRILSIAGVCTIIVLIWIGLRYLIVDDTGSYTRVMMHEFYDQDNIDVVFCGASLCYRTFDTEILDSELGVNTFNTGSSSQTIDVTYYLLKECLDKNKVDHVFVELSPIMASVYNDESRKPSDMTSVYLISDYMKPSSRKAQLLIKASEPDQYCNSFFVARRNWEKIYDTEYVGTLLDKKSSDIYSDYMYDYLKHDAEWYKGKGYVESSIRVAEGTFNDSYPTYNIELENIKESWFDYVYKIIELSANRNVELTLVCAPLSDYLVACYGENYDRYHDRISSIAEQAGIEFWDFTLVKEDYFPTDAINYMDSAHLNMYGAQIFSKLISRIINGELSYDDICYQSAGERISNGALRVLGLASDGINKRIITTMDNNTLVFNISVTTSEGNEYLIQDFSSNKDFCVNEGENGTIHIRTLDENQNENVYDYSF